jgi:hypothetical protein
VQSPIIIYVAEEDPLQRREIFNLFGCELVDERTKRSTSAGIMEAPTSEGEAARSTQATDPLSPISSSAACAVRTATTPAISPLRISRSNYGVKAGCRGFYINCTHCRKEFESLGLRCLLDRLRALRSCSGKPKQARFRRKTNSELAAQDGIRAAHVHHPKSKGIVEAGGSLRDVSWLGMLRSRQRSAIFKGTAPRG